MPAASSGPYQSRIFNFFHKQSRRVSEQLGTAFRHLQVATSWGAQAILYLLFQSNESAGKQLRSSQQKNWLPYFVREGEKGREGEREKENNWQSAVLKRMPPDEADTQDQILTVDRPIQRVLHFVREGARGGQGKKESNWQSVLGQILFSATSLLLLRKDFQKELFALLFSKRVMSSPSLPIAKGNPNLPPAPSLPCSPALFTRGIASQLSTRTLVLVTAENEILDILTPQQQRKLEERIIEEVAQYWRCWQLATANEPISAQALAVIDRTVAVKSTQIASVSAGAIALVHRSWKLVLAVPTQLISRGKTLTIDDTQQAALAKLNEVIAPDAQPHRFKIHALIWAAIDYFFGTRGKPKLDQTVTDDLERGGLLQKLVGMRFNLLLQPFGSKPKQHQVTDDDIDPWLTVGDLFGTPKSKGKHVQHHNIELSASRLTSLDLLLSSRNSKKQIFAQTAKSKVSSVTSTKRGKNQQLEDTVQNHNPPSSSSPVFHDLLHSNSSTQMEPAPDWIETQATVIGYVKHPLEQLLQWLDHLLLWIEELFMKVLEWAQHRTAR